MNNFSISRCVGGAWELTTKHWIMCVVMLVIIVINMLVSGSASPAEELANYERMTIDELLQAYASTIDGSFCLRAVIASILQYIMYAGFYKMALNGYNGLPVNTTAYNMPVMAYVKFVLGLLVFNILFAVGLLLCVIPGIIVGIRFLFTPLILLDEPEIEFIEAFKKSWAMTAGKFWSLFGLVILAVLINCVGFACCCVGIIFTVVLSLFMEVIAYYQLKDSSIMEEAV